MAVQASHHVGSILVSVLWQPILLLLLVWGGRALWRRYQARIKGRMGEFIVRHGALRGLDPFTYRTFEDLYLPRPGGLGSTQIDHVVVSRHGIFVIETKHYNGWIFGRERDATWTQTFRGGRRHSFQNPLRQNWLHVQALAQFLELPESAFHSLVYFSGDAVFKNGKPENVLNSGLQTRIRSVEEVLLSEDEVADAFARLAELTEMTDRRQARTQHVADLQERFADPA